MYRQYDYSAENLWDTCDFLENWNSEFFFDALTEDWPRYKDIFNNPAWSQNSTFLIQATIQKLRGCNIIYLINDRSAETQTAKNYANQIFRRDVLGSVAFNGHETINGDSYSFLEFLQPQKYERIHRKKLMSNTLSQNRHLRALQPEKKRDQKKSKEYDEKQIVSHLKAGWSRAQISEVYRIGNSTLAEIRARYNDELEGLAHPNAKQAHQKKLAKKRQKKQESKQ